MIVYIGIDWSENSHEIVFLNPAGGVIAQHTISHSLEGFLTLDDMRQRLGVSLDDCLVGLETAHNLIIDFLWAHGYQQVYVIPPSVVKSSRGRYGQSGARSDQSDAQLLADLLRTDRARLQPWHPDSLLTRQMRAKVSLIEHLTRSVIRLSNRLRSVLLRYYPLACQVFSDLHSQIGLEFIRCYPTPQAAAQLTLAEFKVFAAQHHYPNPRKLPARFAKLQVTYTQPSQETVLIYQEEAVQLASLLLETMQAKLTALRQLDGLFRQHPDYPIFSSLPGAGKLLAPALLAKFGDDRNRFPTAEGVQALAGTCPVTDESGKRKVIKFRHACDREFRHLVQQWAKCSLSESVWANTYWQQIRVHCHSDSHAYRCLANRWLNIAWKLWHTHQTYNESYHLRQRALRSRPRN